VQTNQLDFNQLGKLKKRRCLREKGKRGCYKMHSMKVERGSLGSCEKNPKMGGKIGRERADKDARAQGTPPGGLFFF